MTIQLGKKSGSISLEKGERVSIQKTSGLKARVFWQSGTDYDVYAVVRMKDGSELVCSTFGSDAQRKPTPKILKGAIRHCGDVGRSGGGLEEMEIKLTDDIDRVAVVAYSAQGNGGGSFRRYQVGMEIDNGAGDKVTINADEANDNDSIYTCVPAVIVNNGDVQIERVEQYSAPGSEYRPTFVVEPKVGEFGYVAWPKAGELVMDKGARNLYKSKD